MPKMLSPLLLCGIAFPPLAAVAAGPDLAPGLWAVTTKTEMVGVPFQMPSRTANICLTREQLAHPWTRLQGSAQQHCKFTKVDVGAHSTRWRMECDGASGHMTGEGTTRYPDRTHMHGTTHMVGRAGGETMHMNVDTVGHWVAAACHG